MRVLILGLTCVWSISGNAVVGGRFARSEEFPFFLRGRGCGFTKVGGDLILTAAHCVSFTSRVGFQPFPVKLSYGSDRMTKINFELNVVSLFVHPDYFWNSNTEGLDHTELGPDIALIQVEPTSEFNAIPSANINFLPVSPGDEVSVIGYGSYIDGLMSSEELDSAKKDYEDPIRKSGALKIAVTTILNLDSLFFATVNFDASGFSARVSKGDSGGPALLKKENSEYDIVGIASNTQKGGGNCKFTRLDSIADWVKNVLTGRDPGLPKFINEIEHKRFTGAAVKVLSELLPELLNGRETIYDCNASWLIGKHGEPDLASYSGSCVIGDGSQGMHRELPYRLMENLKNLGLIGTSGNGVQQRAYSRKTIAKCAAKLFLGVEKLVCAAVPLLKDEKVTREFFKRLP